MNCNCERGLTACVCLMAENKVDDVEVIEAEVISTGLDTVLNEFYSWVKETEVEDTEDCDS